MPIYAFEQFRPTGEHLIATALRRQGPDLPIQVRQTTPLLD